MNEVQKARVDKIMALAEAWRIAGCKEEHAIREDHLRGAIEALLEQQPVQEPQAFLHWYDNAHWGNEDFKEGCHRSWNAAIKYTTPPAQPADHGDELTIAYLDGVHTGKKMAKREWVGLTEEEIYAVRVPMSPEEIARAVEAKLKEKNT
jgi:hypothetical protein